MSLITDILRTSKAPNSMADISICFANSFFPFVGRMRAMMQLAFLLFGDGHVLARVRQSRRIFAWIYTTEKRGSIIISRQHFFLIVVGHRHVASIVLCACVNMGILASWSDFNIKVDSAKLRYRISRTFSSFLSSIRHFAAFDCCDMPLLVIFLCVVVLFSLLPFFIIFPYICDSICVCIIFHRLL